VAELTDSLEYYYKKTRRRITFEQVFFDGVNDTQRELRALIRLARRIPSKINVIPFHPIGFTNPSGFSARLRPSKITDRIVDQLRNEQIPVFVRSSSGKDIEAACGQLAVGVPGTVR
jgi:23S rRNA (adenine2503-C2)-methyltransferase